MPTTREPLRAVNLRLPRRLLEQADELREALKDAPELATLPDVTRSDVLRLAVLKGLQALEDEYEAVVDQGLIEIAEEREAARERLIPLSEVKARLGL